VLGVLGLIVRILITLTCLPYFHLPQQVERTFYNMQLVSQHGSLHPPRKMIYDGLKDLHDSWSWLQIRCHGRILQEVPWQS
jgi:hypothetical protein